MELLYFTPPTQRRGKLSYVGLSINPTSIFLNFVFELNFNMDAR